MQHHSPQKYLHDMFSSCEFLLEFTKGRTVEDYRDDRAFRSAVERELQIIGEALMQLDDARPDIAERIPDYTNIIGFRHVLVHGYDALNPATVWNVIEAKLAPLKDQIRTILRGLPRQ
jgi:uncharacterized protein with HEPN domain